MTPAAPAERTLRLLADGSLSITLSADAAPLAALWLPLGLTEAGGAPGGAVIRVGVAGGAGPIPAGPPTLSLVDVRCWVTEDRAELRDRSPAGASVDLARGRASVALSPADPAATESLLTASAALLLGRAGRALVHAAAVVNPAGGAWLLVGDSHSGKSTTTATLLLGGWEYLSDDQVVVVRRGDAIEATGWRRALNLDAGWEQGEVTGRRVAAGEVGAGRARREAPVAGVLLPRVDAARPTALLPASGVDGFEALVRQSPWLLADRAAAQDGVGLLRRLAGLPVFALRLGRDSYRRPERLLEVLGGLAP